MATVYVDGKYYSREEAKISVYDHGLLYGDGLFEGIAVYHGKPFKLKEHLQRLVEGAKALMITMPLELDSLEVLVLEAVKREGLQRGYIRLLLTRGVGDLGLDPAKCPKASLIIIADTIGMYPLKMYEEGIEIITASTRRVRPDNWDPRIKSLNYLNNIMAKIEARQAGCLEALMLNNQGYIAECTGDNIFFVKNDILKTPGSEAGILEGITRNTIIELAKKRGISVEEGNYTTFDLYRADEVFITGSGAEMLPVIKLDGRAIGNGLAGTIFKTMRMDFLELCSK